ncbi:UNVERIFIED_CONTAM: hypothetical protein H355_002510 [Colinus virginianus]|nr:hypothetical protein H355_002510 [Colinus virginianus]
MVKLLKAGRVVVVLSGRQAGKKGVVVNTWEGSKERQFSYCLVAGIERAPLKVSKRMPWKKVEKRMRVKPFVKYINVNHLMPTRYTVSNDFDVKALVSEESMKTAEEKKKAKKALKQISVFIFCKSSSEVYRLRVVRLHKRLLQPNPRRWNQQQQRQQRQQLPGRVQPAEEEQQQQEQLQQLQEQQQQQEQQMQQWTQQREETSERRQRQWTLRVTTVFFVVFDVVALPCKVCSYTLSDKGGTVTF